MEFHTCLIVLRCTRHEQHKDFPPSAMRKNNFHIRLLSQKKAEDAIIPQSSQKVSLFVYVLIPA